MRKSSIIFFLFLYLFSSTAFSELLRVPLLIEHYSEHQEKEKSISFSDFLRMHYLDHEDHKDDADSDLPFQSHSGSEMVYWYVPLVQFNTNCFLANQSFNDQFEKMKMDPADSFLSSSFLSSIWQPPRNA